MRAPVTVRSGRDIAALVHEIGFLPFYSTPVPGFSLRDLTDPAIWISNDQSVNPWYFRQDVALDERIVYGKLFDGKMGFVDLDLFPDFVRVRRDGRSAREMLEAGLLKPVDLAVLDAIPHGESLTEPLIKENLVVEPKGVPAALARLQTATFLYTASFEYKLTRAGRPYGWPLAAYMRPEEELGHERVFPAPDRSYEAARATLLERVLTVVPDALERSPEGVVRLIDFAMGPKARKAKVNAATEGEEAKPAKTARASRKGKTSASTKK